VGYTWASNYFKNIFAVSGKVRELGDFSFIAESFSGRDGYGPASAQKTGYECAESEERGGCKQTSCGKSASHPVGEDDAKKTVAATA
jgi:hypothetical protein